MKRVYIAHPLGKGADRVHNRRAAQDWFFWAADQPGICPCATWIMLSGRWDESKRERGIEIDLREIETCDEVWLCGPRISAGMDLEMQHALSLGITVRRFDDEGVQVWYIETEAEQ